MLRIRLADGSMSMTRNGVIIEFNMGSLKFSQEFIITRLSGQHQIMLGYDFLKDFSPHIDRAVGSLSFNEMETIQAIVSKRLADVKHLSGKQMSRLFIKEIERKVKSRSNH